MRLGAFVALVSSLAAPPVESAACAAGVTSLEVYSSSDLQDLRAALDCTGGGRFDVAWFGTVAVDDTFYVPDGSDLTVTGSISNSTLDGGHRTPSGFFRLYNNSALSLNNLVLVGGYSTSHGGAVSAWGEGVSPGPIANTINIVDCTFRNNIAESGEKLFVPCVPSSLCGGPCCVDDPQQ